MKHTIGTIVLDFWQVRQDRSRIAVIITASAAVLDVLNSFDMDNVQRILMQTCLANYITW